MDGIDAMTAGRSTSTGEASDGPPTPTPVMITLFKQLQEALDSSNDLRGALVSLEACLLGVESQESNPEPSTPSTEPPIMEALYDRCLSINVNLRVCHRSCARINTEVGSRP